jgi:hypothetical protein
MLKDAEMPIPKESVWYVAVWIDGEESPITLKAFGPRPIGWFAVPETDGHVGFGLAVMKPVSAFRKEVENIADWIANELQRIRSALPLRGNARVKQLQRASRSRHS